ncbi:MAG: hypothetical protein WCK27_16380, partial [Verrucomicrobiota bacterium]
MVPIPGRVNDIATRYCDTILRHDIATRYCALWSAAARSSATPLWIRVAHLLPLRTTAAWESGVAEDLPPHSIRLKAETLRLGLAIRLAGVPGG